MRTPYKITIDDGDIVVTTPKSEMKNAQEEAKIGKEKGGNWYFRRFAKRPKRLQEGNRVFYVEDGYIRGFGIVKIISEDDQGFRCDATDREWPPGWYVHMETKTWKWIRPVPMEGFRGFQYLQAGRTFMVVGGWKSDRPRVRR
jgi:hypothetical protein